MKRLVIFLLVLGRSAAAYQIEGADADAARDSFIAEHGDRPIDAIRIEGLSHTRPGVVRQWLQAHEGQPLSSFRAGATWEDLSRLGIFSRVDISYALDADGGADVDVAVTEKWTLYPVPMALFYGETQLGGLLVADSNAFGANKGWVVGGVYSNRGWYTLAAFVDPNIAFSNFYGRLSVLGGSGLLENDTPAGTELQSFDLGRKAELVRALGARYYGHGKVHEAGPRPDIVLECTGADEVVFAAMDFVRPNGVVCLTGVSSGTHLMSSVNIGKLDRDVVLENNIVVGSVNANRRHYEQAAEALARADRNWLERLITRRVPLDRFAQAYERHPDDVKTILVLGAP